MKECSVELTCEGGIWECQKHDLEIELNTLRERNEIMLKALEIISTFTDYNNSEHPSVEAIEAIEAIKKASDV